MSNLKNPHTVIANGQPVQVDLALAPWSGAVEVVRTRVTHYIKLTCRCLADSPEPGREYSVIYTLDGAWEGSFRNP